MDRHTPHTLSDWLNYLSHAEVDFLSRLAVSLPDNPMVVNIGAGGGTSGLTLLSARPDLFLVTVDIEAGVTPFGGLENERLTIGASGVDYSGRYDTIAGDSKAVGLKWIGKVDMVFVDGDHSYTGCAGDIDIWMPNIKPGGVIALHDYHKVEAYAQAHPSEELTDEVIQTTVKPYPGVDRAVDERLLNQYHKIDVVDTLVAFIK